MYDIVTQINFGGFYESHHDRIVEEAVAFDLGAVDDCDEPDWENEELCNFTNWKSVQTQYCQEWIEKFNDEIGTKIEFTKLDSPREYNFMTDVILVNISVKDTLALFKKIKELDLKEAVIENLKNSTTSRDGYAAYYNYADMFKSENRNFLIEAMIDEILEYENDIYPFILDEFYVNCEVVA